MRKRKSSFRIPIYFSYTSEFIRESEIPDFYGRVLGNSDIIQPAEYYVITRVDEDLWNTTVQGKMNGAVRRAESQGTVVGGGQSEKRGRQ